MRELGDMIMQGNGSAASDSYDMHITRKPLLMNPIADPNKRILPPDTCMRIIILIGYVFIE